MLRFQQARMEIQADHRQILIEAARTRFQDDFEESLYHLWIVVKVYTSKDKSTHQAVKGIFNGNLQDYMLNLNDTDSRSGFPFYDCLFNLGS